MSKKKKKIVLIVGIFLVAVIMILIIFIGSQKNDNNNKTHKNQETKKITIEEALSKQEAVLDNKYDNFVLPDSVQKVDTDNLYIITSEFTETYTDKHYDNFITLLCKVTGDTYVKEDIRDEHDLHASKDSGAGVYTYKGSFDVAKMDCMIARINNATGKEIVIHADEADMNASYDIGGEQYKLSEAVNDAEKFINENIKGLLKSDEDLMLNYIQICETAVDDENGETGISEKTNFIHLIYALTVDGVPVNNDICVPDTEGQKGFMQGCFFRITISKKGEIGTVKLGRYLDSTKKVPVEEDIISFEDALDMASEYLAGYKKYEIVEMGLRYCCHSVFGEKTEVFKPMWRIVLETYDFGDLGPQLKQICVDAVTGEIYFCDSYEGIIKNPTDKD